VPAFGEWWSQLTGIELTWVLIGLAGQGLFMMRFLLQWLYSERAKRSVIPEVFWYFSVSGGLTLLAYAIYRADPVIIIGQLTGVAIYSRNIYFIWREKQRIPKLLSRRDTARP
jgi:lipid-A-disaccharide synthase-like uncharacterized protein